VTVRLRTAAVAALVLAIAGCAHAPGAPDPAKSSAPSRLAPKGPSLWWEDLGDPVLRKILQDADLASLDVKAALARLDQAEAEVALVRAQRVPQVDVGGVSAVGARRWSDSSATAGTPSLSAAWEIDIWGRLAKAKAAARSDSDAAQADVDQARLLVGAETARAYLALRTAEADAAAAERRCGFMADALALIQRRAAAGAAGADAVAAQRRALGEADQRLRAAQTEAAIQRIRLAAILGSTTPFEPPPASDQPTSGSAEIRAASDAVDQRPDVRAAYDRFAAADYRRASAVAASRPRFDLTAALGAPDVAIAVLLDQRTLVWSAAMAVSDTILDGGAKHARIRGAAAEADAADIAYRKAVVQGWTEIQTALIEQAAAEAEAAQARETLADAQAALRRGQVRRRARALDGVGFAALQDQVEAARSTAGQAQRRALEARVQLALARGGA
jgi:multidrug efflux system outer membrane protein